MIFAEFLTYQSLNHLIRPLLQTLDDLTPFFQGRMNFLSPQQRKIVEFLCERRRAVPVSEIVSEPRTVVTLTCPAAARTSVPAGGSA